MGASAWPAIAPSQRQAAVMKPSSPAANTQRPSAFPLDQHHAEQIQASFSGAFHAFNFKKYQAPPRETLQPLQSLLTGGDDQQFANAVSFLHPLRGKSSQGRGDSWVSKVFFGNLEGQPLLQARNPTPLVHHFIAIMPIV